MCLRATSRFARLPSVQNTLLFIALHAYILRNLIKPGLASAQDPHILRKSFIGVVSYLLGAFAAWFSVHTAFLLYMLTPLFFIVPAKSQRVAQDGASSDTPQAPHR